MRLADCFIETFLFTRRLSRTFGTEAPRCDAVRERFQQLFEESAGQAEQFGFSKEGYESAKFAVVAYVDEVILTSAWSEKGAWQKDPLQRRYYDTTNIGAVFYDKLNELNKFGPDRGVLEVYSLCLGLGFKGKYHGGEGRQKHEEVKGFNLSVLVPEEAQRNIDTTTLFPTAFGGKVFRGGGNYKPRTNLIPYIIGIPLAVVLAIVFFYHQLIVERLNMILSVVI